jgi:membrane associated rhomboid family serine protease
VAILKGLATLIGIIVVMVILGIIGMAIVGLAWVAWFAVIGGFVIFMILALIHDWWTSRQTRRRKSARAT